MVMQDIKASMNHISVQENSVIRHHEKLHCYMEQKVSELETEKVWSFLFIELLFSLTTFPM